ncbi:MAG: ABC transporter permease, partial [Parasporobacterium sp.]|nr:ABC transporter permease [Parasporobacterium sp.]
MFRKNYSLIIGCIITGIVLILAIVGLFWTPYSTTAMSAADKLAAPSWQHIFGCDN